MKEEEVRECVASIVVHAPARRQQGEFIPLQRVDCDKRVQEGLAEDGSEEVSADLLPG